MRRFPLFVIAACLLALTACSTPPAPEPTVTTLPGPTLTPTLTATPTPTPTVNPALAPFMSQKLKWKKCEGNLECTTLLVPLDYAAPEYSPLNIAVIRRTATDTKKHKNAIVVNPGGPGGSGFDYVANSSTIVGSSVSKTFDVVGFDPRGVGRSSPIKCLTPAQSDRFYASDGSPDSDAEATAVFLIGKEFAKVCEYSDPTILGFLGTRESAQDMDILRAALGQKQLNYVGKSYGTSLGTQYAKQFPTKVGRFVLDGAIDPSLDADAFAAGQATGFERALQAFLKDCVQRSSCALGRSVTKAQDRLNVFFRQLDATPEQVGDRKLTEALGTLGVAASLYSTDSWGTLRKALAQGLRGDGRGLLALADYYSNRNEDGTYADNSLDSFYAITCLDRTDAKGIDAIQALATKLTENNSSTFGAFIAWGSTPCSSWPVKATLVPEKVTAAGSRPIVVVGTTRDPATPFEWSQALANQLAKGVLVTRDGDGHTGYRQGNSCVDEAIDRYLAKGTVPEDGLFCS